MFQYKQMILITLGCMLFWSHILLGGTLKNATGIFEDNPVPSKENSGYH